MSKDCASSDERHLASTSRILVLGSPGAGKTRLSLALQRALGLPLHHLDDLYWTSTWRRAPEDEFVKAQSDILATECWILDGMHLQSLHLRLGRAEAIVFLDVPPPIAVSGFLLRGLRRALGERSSLPKRVRTAGGPPVLGWDWGLILRILWFRSASRPEIEQQLARRPDLLVLRFASRRAAARHVEELGTR